ncbi:MAG TPA: hypothetical protein VNN25_21950 [Thermoanaerobaculia bacterium]|nr:hypothetical protein [Thermoanaerobaculia bacterium]
MKPIAIAVLSMSLAAVSHAVTIALGVGAIAPNEVIVKIDGHDSHLRIAGVKPSGDPAAATFLRCLVAGRVLRVQPSSGGAAKITMLDDSVVADLVNEYFDTTTKIDPCALGKAAYQPKPLHPVEATAEQTTPAAPAPTKHKGKLTFPSLPSSPAAAAQPPTPFRMPADVKFPEPQAAPRPAPKSPDVGSIGTPGTMQPYTPGQAHPDTLGTSSTTPMQQGGTSTIGTAQPTNVETAQPYTPPVTPQKPPGE